MAKPPVSKLDLTPEEQTSIDKSFESIRNVLSKKNINVENVIGLVTTDDLAATTAQVKIKFAEETGAVMNMIAFD